MAAAINTMLEEVEDFELPPRKKPKVSELPLSSAQRASIDGMLHTFKKKGDFDALRKKAFQQYNESAQRGMFEAALRKFTSDEIEREPLKYLRPDRRLAAPLLEGAAARANVYDKSQADVDNYIEQYLANAESTLREIRRKEIGDAAAEEEIARGSKSEEAYAMEAEERRKDRAKKFAEAEKLRLKKEAQERRKKEMEALKKKHEELQKETERLQREKKRREEREEWKKAEKEREKERIRKFNEEREKQQKEAEEREKAAQVEREKRQKEKEQRDKERLEQEALELLLREGRALTDKSRRPELERSESMEPPPRLRHNAPSTNFSKEEMRARGLMPTSLTLRKGDNPSPIPTGPRASASTLQDDEVRKRNSRLRSPSPSRSVHSRGPRESLPYPDERRSSRREDSRDYYRDSSMRDRRESYYRDVDARRYDDRSERERERERDRARDRDRDREREREREREKERDKGEEGEVVERPSARPRSRSRESYRRRESPRRSHRERSRSRSPPRYSALRRRSRSRSPAGIDRYVPGGGGGGTSGRERDRERDRDVRRDRSRDRDRYRDRERESDRYVPRSDRDDADRPRRRERSRSRERRRERSRDSYRERDRGRD